MKIKDIMISKPHTVTPQHTLLAVHKIMIAEKIRHLPVMEDGALVGILCDRDIGIHQENTGESIFSNDTDTVAMAMRGNVITASPDDAVSEAANRMATAKVGCLPILVDDEFVGLVTATDILANYPQTA